MRHETRTCDIPVPHDTDLPGSVPIRRCGNPVPPVRDLGDGPAFACVVIDTSVGSYDVCAEHAKLPFQELVKLVNEREGWYQK